MKKAMLFCAYLSIFSLGSLYSQEDRISNLTNSEIVEVSEYAYMYYGSVLFTGRMIFYGLQEDPMNEEI